MATTLVFERQAACREKVWTGTLEDGVLEIQTDFRKVHHVNVTQADTTAADEGFAWSFDSDTGLLTIASSNATSAVDVSVHALAY